MEKFEKKIHPFRELCHADSLQKFREELCNPRVDARRSEAIEQILRDHHDDIQLCDQLRASLSDRLDKGDFDTTGDPDKDMQSQAELKALREEIETSSEYIVKAICEICESRSLITSNEYAEYGFRVVSGYRPILYRQRFEGGACWPDINQDPKALPCSMEQLVAFVVHRAAFVRATADIRAVLGALRKHKKDPLQIDMIYMDPPEENFFSVALAEQVEGGRAHDFTPPLLARSVFQHTDLYRGLCAGLLNAARYGMLQEVLPGGLDTWAQQPELRESTYPTAAFIDLMMSQAFAYFSERNVALSTSALEAYFSGRSPRTPTEYLEAETILERQLGLEPGVTLEALLPRRESGLLLASTQPNPFRALIKIWESGLAPVYLGYQKVGIAYSPLSRYIKPKDIPQAKIDMARTLRELRGPRTHSVTAAQIEDMIRRLVGDGIHSDE